MRKITIMIIVLLINFQSIEVNAREYNCLAYLDKEYSEIESGSLQIVDSSCDDFRRIIFESRNEIEFRVRISEILLGKDYHTKVIESYIWSARDEVMRAVLALDKAGLIVNSVFVRSGDMERSNFYGYLIMRQKYQNLERADLIGDSFLSNIGSPPEILLEKLSGNRVDAILYCAIRLDPITVPLSILVNSAVYHDCIDTDPPSRKKRK